MIKTTPVLTAFLAVALVASTGCSHTGKADQLAALDNAYHAGLLTKDEYEAKKRALTGIDEAPAPEQAPAHEASSSPVADTPVKVVHAKPPASPRRAAAPAPASPTTLSSSPAVAKAIEPEPAPHTGCEDTEYKSGGQKGAEERFFAASPEIVRRAAVSVLDSMDFNIHKNSDKEIDASKKRHLGAIVGTGGERVILTFKEAEREGQSGTRVIGQTKKNFIGHVSQKTWTDAVLAEMACELAANNK